jgi:23S rRNA (pseudouridine1915-N3)-methyltransferase
MPAWINTGFKEYNKRLPKEFYLNLIEVPAATRSKSSSTEKIMAEESKRIRAVIPEGSLIIALDEHGKQLGSISLSKKLDSWTQEGRDVTFVIGGADGLADEIKQSTDMLWSLSSLTLPHALVRVILVEQVYRAWTIMDNHPYHRE